MALEEIGCQHYAPADLLRGTDPAPIAQKVRLVSGPVWMGLENLAPSEIRARTNKTVNIFMHIFEKKTPTRCTRFSNLFYWHVYVLWLGYPLKWPCNTTLRDFLVASSPIKNPMRRHKAVIQCASGHASFAIWYTTLYTHWLFISVTSVHVSVSRDLATPKGCIHNN